MNTIYVGDSKNVVKRIRNNHCNGNVEASALRRYIAIQKGYTLKKTRRPSGFMRVRINSEDPRNGEQAINSYIRSGTWKYILCESYEESHDFQWYVIDKLKPLLNRNRKNWKEENETRYAQLFNALINDKDYNCNELANHQDGPGVYVFYHPRKPSRILNEDISTQK